MAQAHCNLVPSSQVTLMTVNPVVAKPGLAEQVKVMTSVESLSLVLFCFTAALAILILMLPDVWQAARTSVITLNRCHQIPCRNCRFFIDNRYLRCTVQPSFVLTQQAVDCADFHPLSHDRS